MILKWFVGITGEIAVKAKWKELLKEHHPDKHSTPFNIKLATEKTKIINQEYEWLKNNDWEIVKEPFSIKDYSKFTQGGKVKTPTVNDIKVKWQQPKQHKDLFDLFNSKMQGIYNMEHVPQETQEQYKNRLKVERELYEKNRKEESERQLKKK